MNRRCFQILGLMGAMWVLMGQAGTQTATKPTGEVKLSVVQEFLELQRKVPELRFGDVWEEAREWEMKEGWTREKRMLWMMEKLRVISAEEGPGTKGWAELGAKGKSLPTGDFGRFVMAVRFFSQDFGIAVTSDGVLTTDGSLDRWKGRNAWKAREFPTCIVGGSEKGVYLVASANREVVVKEGYDRPAGRERDPRLRQVLKKGKEVLTEYEYTHVLWRWSAGEGLVEVRKMPDQGTYSESSPAACDFWDERMGAMVEGGNLMVTLDGAKTWVGTEIQFETRDNQVKQVLFCGSDLVAVTTGSEEVAMMAVGKDGAAKEIWRKKVFGRFGQGALRLTPAMAFDRKEKVLWVYSDDLMGSGARLEGFRAEDGKLMRSFAPFGEGESLVGFVVSDGRMWAKAFGKRGGDVLSVRDLKDERKEEIRVDHEGRSLEHVACVPGTGEVYFVVGQRRMVMWDGTGRVPEYDTSKTKRPWVELGELEGAEDRRPPGEDPTRKEMKAMGEARKGLTNEEYAQLMREFEGKRYEFENHRELVLWMTKRANELKEAGVKTREGEKRK